LCFPSAAFLIDFLQVNIRFYFTSPFTPDIYTLSLHDALPICSLGHPIEQVHTAHRWGGQGPDPGSVAVTGTLAGGARLHLAWHRSEEHTSELQSRFDLVCRLLLEKKKTQHTTL